MIVPSLPTALRAGAEGIYTLEAAVGLIIAHGTWLTRGDFTCFVHHGDRAAAIDWETAIHALDTGGLPSSSGEKRMPRLAASPADQASISLGAAITGIGDRNTGLLIDALRRAPGRRQFPR